MERSDKTLEQLEGEFFAPPEYKSSLVLNVHRLRRIPLNEFTVEDLRLMIGQELSLEYLVPLAIENLKEDPFVAGDYYRGDLLKNVLGVRSGFWEEVPELRREMEAIAKKAALELRSLQVIDDIEKDLSERLAAFYGET